MKIDLEAPEIDLGSSGQAALRAYLALFVVGGHVGLPLALITTLVFQTASKKYLVLVNVFVSWIIYSTDALLLFYFGEYQDRQPDFGLCLAQSSLLYGSTVMAATAGLCLVLRVWVELPMRQEKYTAMRNRFSLVFLIVPWFCLATVTTSAIIYGIRNKSKVSYRWQFYCTISSNAVTKPVSGLTVLAVVVMFCFEVSTLRTLYKASRQIRATNRNSYCMYLRVSIFSVYTLLIFFIYGLHEIVGDLIFPYIFVSTLPLTAFAIFGTTQDSVAVWKRCLWRPRKEETIRLEHIRSNSATSQQSTSATRTV